MQTEDDVRPKLRLSGDRPASRPRSKFFSPIPTAIKNDRWHESFSARRRPPIRRAIPTAEIVARANDFRGWYRSVCYMMVDTTSSRTATPMDGCSLCSCSADHRPWSIAAKCPIIQEKSNGWAATAMRGITSHGCSIKPQRPSASIEVDPRINLVEREVDAKFRQANWSGRVGSVPVPRLLTRFAPERTE
jgi:hypothetical protein